MWFDLSFSLLFAIQRITQRIQCLSETFVTFLMLRIVPNKSCAMFSTLVRCKSFNLLFQTLILSHFQTFSSSSWVGHRHIYIPFTVVLLIESSNQIIMRQKNLPINNRINRPQAVGGASIAVLFFLERSSEFHLVIQIK